jgi:hypothetical protein
MASDEDAAAPGVPESLLRRLRADPVRAPETLALAAAERHGPAAADWVAQQRRERPRASSRDLAKRAKRRHAALARYGGAATGLGGLATVLPDLVLLAWIQSRMVFFIAAAYDHDPRDPMRPAELLVLQDVYDDPQEARRALDGAGRPLAIALVGRHISREKLLVRRLAKMAGKRVTERFAGRAIPGVASVVGAIANESDTRALADRAIRFYGG